MFQAISALLALYEATPDDLKETKPVRYVFLATAFQILSLTWPIISHSIVKWITTKSPTLFREETNSMKPCMAIPQTAYSLC